ncbi:MAG: hypothetical protein WKG06_18180 [Segetibacter sp.]
MRLLNEAVAAWKTNWKYDEPPDWLFRYAITSEQYCLETAKYSEAEKIYNQDLETYHENGWALMGLYTALQKQNKTIEAHNVKLRFDKAWKYADIKISSSSNL